MAGVGPDGGMGAPANESPDINFSPEVVVNVPPAEQTKWDTSEWWEKIEQLYPGWAKVINSQSGLRESITTFFAGLDPNEVDWSEMETQLLNLMKSSKWYTTQAQSVRESIILEAEDPATYKYNIRQTKKDIREILFNNDLSLHSAVINVFAEEAERYDWDLNQLKEHLVQAGRAGDKPVRGGIKRTFEDIKSYAQAMLTPIGDGDAWDFAYKIEAGNDSMDNAHDHIQSLATETFDFVNVQELATRGTTISDLLSGAKEQIATTLDLNSNDVRLYDMSLDDLVVGEGDSKRFINRQDAEAWAKKQGRYQMTDAYRGDVRNLASGIANHFGTRAFGGYV